jgi:hypothetical integral membrane protein (TIGR02206 family)
MISIGMAMFGHEHCQALGLTAVVALVMIIAARRRSPIARHLELVLAMGMLASWPMLLIDAWGSANPSREAFLPLQYCNLATFAAAIALLTYSPRWIEIIYFCGLTGMLQGLLTPALPTPCPPLQLASFFLSHSGGVITAIYVIVGIQVIPDRSALSRVIVLSLSFVAFAMIANSLLGTNYGFFRSKPPTASILDACGPWPWYVVVMIVLVTLWYCLLDLPLRWLRTK